MSKRKLATTVTKTKVDVTVKDIERLTAELHDELLWAVANAYASGGPRPDTGGRPTDPSNPTMNAVTSGRRDAMRDGLVDAMEYLFDARASLKGAMTILEKAGGKKGGQASGHTPKLISDDEYRASQDAQRRRDQRGEGHGA